MKWEVDICWPIVKCDDLGEYLKNVKLSRFIEVDKITKILQN